MAVNVSNNIVGEATIKLGTNANATTIAAMNNFADIGATQNGLEISWEPDMVDIEIDQFGDAHAANGFCQAIRKATVSGTLVGDQLIAKTFVLIKEVQ